MGLEIVKFIRGWRMFHAGDVAGVSDANASDLIKQKFAEPFQARASVAKTTASPSSEGVPALTLPLAGKRKPGRPRKVVQGSGKDVA